MDAIAMWVGYTVMAAGAMVAVAFAFGMAATYAWRKLREDVPSFLYIQRAVAMYRKQHPPGRWARDQIDSDWLEKKL